MSDASELQRECDELAARRGAAAATMAALEERRARAAREVELKRRVLVALDRRGLVGSWSLGAITGGMTAWQVGTGVGRDPSWGSAFFLLVVIVLGALAIRRGLVHTRRETAVLAAARAHEAPARPMRVGSVADRPAEDDSSTARAEPERRRRT